MSAKIVVLGSLNLDLVIRTERHPHIGETLLGGQFASFPGGKGANQAVATARLGASTLLVGRVGADKNGELLVESARADGIDVTHVSVDPKNPTGVALITVSANGKNTIVVAAGANATLTAAVLQQSAALFQPGNLLVAQLETPLDTVYNAIKMALFSRMPVVLNPAPAQPLPPSLLAKVDYLIPNEHEVLLLAGKDELEPAIAHLFELGVKNLIITLGEKGVLWATPTSRIQVPAFRVQAVDTVAAGDAFVGAFAVGLSEGLTGVDLLRFANATAALSVTRHGAQPSLPKRAEVQEFLSQIK